MSPENGRRHIKPSGHINKQFARWEARERGGWQYLARDRREFIALLGGAAAAWPLAAHAQQVGKVPKIGYLSPGSASPGPLAYHDEFQRGLRELGYVEGRNIIIEYRFADGKFDRLDQFAAGFVRLDVDIIVFVVKQTSPAGKKATRTVPIVIVCVACS